MTWNELSDRCRLYIDADEGMLIALLKEAELEMTRKANIWERDVAYVANGTNIYGLPSDFKAPIHIMHDGDKLIPILEDSVNYDSDGSFQTGTPLGYFVRNNNLMLDYKVASGTIRMSYYAVVETDATEPQVPSMYHRDLCDYAIALASAKAKPELHDKHMQFWMMKLEQIKNEDADRELVHYIKEDI
jgi:hypothetical protein